MTEEQNAKFPLILIHFNLTSHMWLTAPILDSASLRSLHFPQRTSTLAKWIFFTSCFLVSKVSCSQRAAYSCVVCALQKKKYPAEGGPMLSQRLAHYHGCPGRGGICREDGLSSYDSHTQQGSPTQRHLYASSVPMHLTKPSHLLRLAHSPCIQ